MRVAMGRIDTQGAGWTDARFPRNDLDVVQLFHRANKINKSCPPVKSFANYVFLDGETILQSLIGYWLDTSAGLLPIQRILYCPPCVR